jgi:hypothetical protein
MDALWQRRENDGDQYLAIHRAIPGLVICAQLDCAGPCLYGSDVNLLYLKDRLLQH